MSLIDEALKRAQASQNDPARGGTSAHAPLPLPDRDLERARRRMRIGLLALLPVALLGATVLLLGRRSKEPSSTAEPSSSASSEEAAARGTGPEIAPATEARPQRAPDRPAQIRSLPRETLPAGRFEDRPDLPRADAPEGPAAVAAAPDSAPMRIPPSVPLVASASPMIVRSDEPRRPAARGKPVVRETVLASGARIVLDGIVFSEESPAAVINGRVVSAGSFVDGVEVLQIRRDRVELKDGATTIVLLLK